MEERAEKIISFLKEIEKFKFIEREIFLSNNRRENDAEHSWHLAMFLILFEKDLPKDIDNEKMLKMAMIHDLAEIYAGDTFFFDDEARKDKEERERKAAEKLFSQLPKDLEADFWNLFREYVEGKTKESKIVHSFDKIQPLLQNLCSKGKIWKKHEISYENLDKKQRGYAEHDEKILEIYDRLMEEANEVINNL